MDFKNGCGMKFMCFSPDQEHCLFTARAQCPRSVFYSFSELYLKVIPSAKLKIILKNQTFCSCRGSWWGHAEIITWRKTFTWIVVFLHPSLTASLLPPVSPLEARERRKTRSNTSTITQKTISRTPSFPRFLP